MKNWFFVIGIALFFVILIGFFVIPKGNSVCVNGNCIEVELALNQTQREKGLMDRESLESNKGMLFVFEKEDIHPFWMNGTLFPLDMVWVARNGTVVDIMENAQPCVYPNCLGIFTTRNATYVIEINANKTRELGINVGTQLEINLN
ncbi:MAG: DUF192 domain-containing protein [Candidatus Micrarchaeota archaeon]